MPRLTDRNVRNKEILLEAIELYLKLAQPISSDFLSRSRRLSLSSATVRNVFSELEDMGFLTHPHTSAGRIPTDEGYRFYINMLMKKKTLNRNELGFIDKIYELKVKELDDLLFETTKLMSDFTHYTSLVCFSSGKGQKTYYQGARYILEHPEFYDIQKAHMVLEALEEKEKLNSLINLNFTGSYWVYIGKECDCPEMEHCSVVVSRYEGHENRNGRLALIGPKRMAYNEVIPLMEYISETLSNAVDRF
jgi:transcriptional regulator of heat shock response